MKVRCHTCRRVVAGYESRDGNHRPLDHERRVVSEGSCCTSKDCRAADFEDAPCPGSGTAGTLVEREGERGE